MKLQAPPSVAPAPNGEPTAALQIDVGGSPFEIRFARSQGKTDYIIPLSRLWIWHAAHAAGTTVQIRSSGDSSLLRVTSHQVAVGNDRLHAENRDDNPN